MKLGMNTKAFKVRKQYTLEQYEEFCNEALDAPPCFEDEGIDELQWYAENKVRIIKGNHEIVLDYMADVANELTYALREMYKEEYGDGAFTTGNAVGCGYRPAELKDIVRVAVQNDWDKWGYQVSDFGIFIREFVKRHDNLTSILGVYDAIYKNLDEYTEMCKCNFNTALNIGSLKDVNREVVKRTIGDLIGTNRELLYGITEDNKTSDIVFVMDYTLKPSGELIGWFYGQDDIDEEYIDGLIEDYKNKIFGEEN